MPEPDASTSPQAAPLAAAAPAGGVSRRVGRIAVQAVGFLLGIAMLGWCVRLALSGENRAALERLADAPAWALGAMFGLSALGVAANGLIFWATLAPVRRLWAVDVVATNFLATFLANLPFKIGLLARIAIHRRRDGVPLAVVMAWMAATASTLVLASGSLLVALPLRSLGAGAALPAAALSAAVLGVALVVAAGPFAGRAGHRRTSRLVARLGGRRALRLARSGVVRELHAAADMLACGRWIALVLVLRGVDFGSQAARLGIAADLVGVEMPAADAVLISGGHYVVGALSPFGMLGFREGAAMGAGGLLGYDGPSLAPVALLASGSEVLATIAGAGLALAWLRLDRVLAGKPARRVGAGA